MQNLITKGQLLLVEKYVAEKERKKKNNTKYSGHFVPQQRPRAAHALRSDQKLVILQTLKFMNLNVGTLEISGTLTMFLITWVEPLI